MQGVEDLIEPLAEATRSGALNWEDEGNSVFASAIGDYKVLTWQWTDENDGSSGVTVGLKSKAQSGPALDNITANEYSTRYDRLSDFFNLARRSALNVDDIVTSLKRDLKALRSR